MTTLFLEECGVNHRLATAHTYECVDIIESCIGAINEGGTTLDVITTMSSYSHSMIIELLDNVKEGLVKLAQNVLSALNNYFINTAKLTQKYRWMIIEKFAATKSIVLHETFEFPELKNYPAVLNSKTNIENDVVKLQAEIGDPTKPMTPSKVAMQINRLLRDFSKKIIDDEVDVYAIKSSTERIVRKKVRGKKVNVQITADTLSDYMDDILNYKRDKDDIQETKKNVIDDYQQLKRTYQDVTKDHEEFAKHRLPYSTNPDRDEFIQMEQSRYASIHVEMIRLFNSFITIYQAAFDTKLNELKEKINDRRHVLVEIMTTCGVFAAINTKDYSGNGKPIPYNPTKV